MTLLSDETQVAMPLRIQQLEEKLEVFQRR